ncbi:MAG: glycosyltransferase family 2 protein [Flavobacteriales bacterium]|nr:glycosyltransferase family 2 protein [Flavobacteriales bacterium]
MKLSVVTPIYYDSSLAERFVEAVGKINYTPCILHEIIFVVDGGSSKDEEILKKIASDHSYVKVIFLSRNFGQHIALSAGYKASTGDYVCMINVDQQDPPKEILKLLHVIVKEPDTGVVYGLRNERKDSFAKSWSSMLFNYILNKLTGDNTPLNVATLRVMSRKFVDSYNELTEKARYIPGLESWIGFDKKYIPIESQDRIEGKSSYNFRKRLNMAMESIVSFSDLPLRWSAYIGMLIAIIGFLSLIVLTFMKVYFIDFQSGYVSTIALILFVGGIQIFVVGLASIYIGRILKEVQNRPLYIVKDKINL